MEASNRQNIFMAWVMWQFYEVPNFLLDVWKNYILFASNYFSLPILLKSLFAPWRRYRWRYPKGFDLVEFFNTLISNTFSRILGALMRVILIVVGILFQIFVVIVGAIIFLAWMLMPFVVIVSLLFVLVW
jgi:hypothetical protein